MKSLNLTLVSLFLTLGISHAAAAQTTHQVDLDGFDFLPADITIDEGDTVLWNWLSGAHNVVSDDGLFSSGRPVTPPMTYSITFDAAFLASAPANGNVYNYNCEPHVFLGMVGSVTVLTSSPVLTVNNLTAGSAATLTVQNSTPSSPVGFAYSLAGPGPSTVPAGACGLITTSLSLPITVLPQAMANSGGSATLSLGVPAGISGTSVWVQALDFASCTLSNGATMVIG